MEFEGGRDASVERNTTNIGGLFRLWRLQVPGVKEEMKSWFSKLLQIDQEASKYFVYFMEETKLGAPWEVIRNDFYKDFGIEIVS